MTIGRKSQRKSSDGRGIRQIKLLGLNSNIFCSEKYFETRNLELIDAVLQNIELWEDDGDDINDTVLTDKSLNKANETIERQTEDLKADENAVPVVSVVLLKERTKRAKQITTVPFVGNLESSLLTIEAQLKGVLVAGKPLVCSVCESSDVKQNKQLIELSAWRKTLMSGLKVNANGKYAKI